MAVGIELRGAPEPAVPGDQDVVDPFIGLVGVADAVDVGPRRARRDRRRQRQFLVLGAQHHGKRHGAAGRGAKDRHVLRLRHLHRFLPHRHRVVHRRGIGRVRRHAVVDRDHLEAAEPGHQHGFERGRFTGREHVAAAMDVDQEPVLVDRRDGFGGDDEDLDPGDGGGLHRDAEFLLHRRQRRHDQLRALVDQRLPLRRRLGIGVEVRRIGRLDQGLQLRTDVVRRRRWTGLGRRMPVSRRGIGRCLARGLRGILQRRERLLAGRRAGETGAQSERKHNCSQ